MSDAMRVDDLPFAGDFGVDFGAVPGRPLFDGSVRILDSRKIAEEENRRIVVEANAGLHEIHDLVVNFFRSGEPIPFSAL